MIAPELVEPEHRARISRFADATWSFAAAIKTPSAPRNQIHWDTFPAALREQFRLAAWALANYPAPEEFLARCRAGRATISFNSTVATACGWRIFARWLAARSVTSLSEVTSGILADYARYLVDESGTKRGTCSSRMVGLLRLYFLAPHLPEHYRISEPPWLSRPLKEFLPPEDPTGENQTPPISPDTIAPLLVWALRFVEDFASDILAAQSERQRLIERSNLSPQRANWPAARDYLDRLVAERRPFPAIQIAGGTSVANQYLAGRLGISPMQLSNGMSRRPDWRRHFDAAPGPCPLGLPVNGRLNGIPWTEPIDFNDVPELLRHLGTACFITTAYLTGMRPGETLALAAGCCPDPETTAETAGSRYKIYGRHFKDARDIDGNYVNGGLLRETPWHTVPQVAAAIRVLEQLAPTGLLFAADIHDKPRRNRGPGRALTATTMSNRIEDFIDWVNEHLAQGDRGKEAIPADPHGNVTTSRFRRTLAWHIARQPDGLVALAIQYGHLRTVVSEGYASRSRDGIHDLLDFETARTIAEHLSDLGDDLARGEGVSGPAARRLIQAAGRCTERFGGTVTTERQYKALLSDPMLTIYENKSAYLTCNYDPAKALCRPDRAVKGTAPSLDRCQVGCANIARTDRHAKGLRAEANRLEKEAAAEITPPLIADRLRERSAHLRGLADRHDTDRITTGQEHHQ